MPSFMSSIRSYSDLSLAKLCSVQGSCMLTMTGLIEHMKGLSRRTHAYLLSLLVIRVILSIWHFYHEAAAEVLLVVWPITLAAVYFLAVWTKGLLDIVSSEINGFRAGLELETGSIWCSNVLYGKRNAPRDYQEDLDYRYCLQELAGIGARPEIQRLKAKLVFHLGMALLLLLLAVCSYVLGRLHAWYKHSRAVVAKRDFGTGMEHSTKPALSRARPVYVRRVRHFLRPTHMERSSTSNPTASELGRDQRSIHDVATAGISTTIRPNQATLPTSSTDAGLEQQITALKGQLENVNRQHDQLKGQAGALAHEKEQLQAALQATRSDSEEIASLKRRLAEQETSQETQRNMLARQRKRFDERYAATTLAEKRLAGAEAREARLGEKVRRLEEALEFKTLEAELEAEMLRNNWAAERDETALAQAQLRELQSEMANISAMPAAIIRCDHEDYLRMVEKDARDATERVAAAAAEQKEQEMTQLRQAAETEIRSLQTLLQTCREEYQGECYRVSILQSNLGIADYRRGVLEGDMVTLQEAGERTKAENAELRLQMAMIREELASAQAQCKRLEESHGLGLNTAGSVLSSIPWGNVDDAVVPFENPPPSWQPRPFVRPDPSEAARVAARAKAPLPPRGSAEERAANASSAPMLQEVVWQRKPMSVLDESHFADRITRFVEVASKSYQKWNASTLSQADGAEKVAANFLDILRNWQYVQPYMVEKSRLKRAAENIVSTEGKWPARLLHEQAPGFQARAKMVKFARDILIRIDAMTETEGSERTGNKRSRS